MCTARARSVPPLRIWTKLLKLEGLLGVKDVAKAEKTKQRWQQPAQAGELVRSVCRCWNCWELDCTDRSDTRSGTACISTNVKHDALHRRFGDRFGRLVLPSSRIVPPQ